MDIVSDSFFSYSLQYRPYGMEDVWRLFIQRETLMSVNSDLYKIIIHSIAQHTRSELEKSGMDIILWPDYPKLFRLLIMDFCPDNVEWLLEVLNYFHNTFSPPLETCEIFLKLFVSLLMQALRQKKLRETKVNTKARLPTLNHPPPRLVVIYRSFIVKNKFLLDQFLKKPPEFLTLLMVNAVVRLRLAEPEPIAGPNSIHRTYKCSTCQVQDNQPGYKIVSCDYTVSPGLQDTVSLEKQSEVTDLCMACAFYFYCMTSRGVSRVINEAPKRFRVCSCTGIYMIHLSSKDDQICVKFRLEPRGAQPIVWITKGDMIEPPPYWRSQLQFTQSIPHQYSHDEDSDNEDKCVICFGNLNNGMVVWQAFCGHCFHEYCVQKMMQKTADKCPLCRQKGVFAKGNKLTVYLHEFEVRMKRPYNLKQFVLVIGALLPSDGEYHNYTNISACRSFIINHPWTRDFHERKKILKCSPNYYL